MSGCEAAREAAQAYLDGELSPQERCAVEAHLASCAGCRRAVAAYGRLFEALGRPAIPPPARLVSGVLRAVAAAERRRARWQAVVMAAAVLVATGALVLLAWQDAALGAWGDLAGLGSAETWESAWPSVTALGEGICAWAAEGLAAAPGGAVAVAAVLLLLAVDALLAYRWRFLARLNGASRSEVMR